jgi:hypothetical protein
VEIELAGAGTKIERIVVRLDNALQASDEYGNWIALDDIWIKVLAKRAHCGQPTPRCVDGHC